MFIIYGTKHRERRLGRRGDVCDGCLGMSPFDIVRIDAAPHLYYVPLRGKEARRLQEWLRCGMRVPIASTVDGTPEGFDSLNDLALATNSRDELRQSAARLKLLHDREGEWLHETRARQFSELQAPPLPPGAGSDLPDSCRGAVRSRDHPDRGQSCRAPLDRGRILGPGPGVAVSLLALAGPPPRRPPRQTRREDAPPHARQVVPRFSSPPSRPRPRGQASGEAFPAANVPGIRAGEPPRRIAGFRPRRGRLQLRSGPAGGWAVADGCNRRTRRR